MNFCIISATKSRHNQRMLDCVLGLSKLHDVTFINSNPDGASYSEFDKQTVLRHNNYIKKNGLLNIDDYNDSGWYHKKIILPCIEKITDCDYVLIMHDDVVFQEKTLFVLIEELKNTENLAVSAKPEKLKTNDPIIGNIDKLSDHFLLLKYSSVNIFKEMLLTSGKLCINTLSLFMSYCKEKFGKELILISEEPVVHAR